MSRYASSHGLPVTIYVVSVPDGQPYVSLDFRKVRRFAGNCVRFGEQPVVSRHDLQLAAGKNVPVVVGAEGGAV